MKKLFTIIFLGALLCSACKKKEDSNYQSPPHLPDRFIVSSPNGDISTITEYTYNVSNQLVNTLQKSHPGGDTVWVTYFKDERIVRKATSLNTHVYSYVHFDNLIKKYSIWEHDTTGVYYYFIDDEYKVTKSVSHGTTDTVFFEWEGGNNIRSIEYGVAHFKNTYYQNVNNPYLNENKYFRYSWDGGLNFKNTLHDIPDSDTLTFEVIEVEVDKPLFVKVYYQNKHISNLEFQY